jgi:hypothetical protein
MDLWNVVKMYVCMYVMCEPWVSCNSPCFHEGHIAVINIISKMLLLLRFACVLFVDGVL